MDNALHKFINWKSGYGKLIEWLMVIGQTKYDDNQKKEISDKLIKIIKNGDETEVANMCCYLFGIYTWDVFLDKAEAVIMNRDVFILIRYNLADGMVQNGNFVRVKRIISTLSKDDELRGQLKDALRNARG